MKINETLQNDKINFIQNPFFLKQKFRKQIIIFLISFN